MKTGSMPCRVCHRLKPTDITRCCAGCTERLRNMEKRRPAPQETGPKNSTVFIEPNLD
jgi:hypothetical protein